MSDLISRKALLEFIEENYNPSWYNPTTAYFKDIITNAPTIQQEAIAESDKRIAELEDEINDLKKEQDLLNKWLDSNRVWFDNSNKEIAELKAHINVLREALEVIADDSHEDLWQGHFSNEALASTPAQSLVQHDNEVIEKVVTLLKDSAWDDGIIDMRVDDLIEDVRKLKGK